MKRFFKKIALTSVLALGFMSTANAALDTSGIVLDVSQVEVIGLVIMSALGVIWVVRKVVSMLRG